MTLGRPSPLLRPWSGSRRGQSLLTSQTPNKVRRRRPLSGPLTARPGASQARGVTTHGLSSQGVLSVSESRARTVAGGMSLHWARPLAHSPHH